MNLAPVGVEHAHGDGARRPIRVDDKLDRARNVLSVGAPFANDISRAVQELDSVLHPQRSTVAQALHEESDSPLGQPHNRARPFALARIPGSPAFLSQRCDSSSRHVLASGRSGSSRASRTKSPSGSDAVPACFDVSEKRHARPSCSRLNIARAARACPSIAAPMTARRGILLK